MKKIITVQVSKQPSFWLMTEVTNTAETCLILHTKKDVKEATYHPGIPYILNLNEFSEGIDAPSIEEVEDAANKRSGHTTVIVMRDEKETQSDWELVVAPETKERTLICYNQDTFDCLLSSIEGRSFSIVKQWEVDAKESFIEPNPKKKRKGK